LDDLGDSGYRYDILPSSNMEFNLFLRLLGIVGYPNLSEISLVVRHPSLISLIVSISVIFDEESDLP